MPDSPLIPPAIWDVLVAYLAAGKTGTVELCVKQGRIVEAYFPTRVRHDDSGPDYANIPQ